MEMKFQILDVHGLIKQIIFRISVMFFDLTESFPMVTFTGLSAHLPSNELKAQHHKYFPYIAIVMLRRSHFLLVVVVGVLHVDYMDRSV